MPQAPRGANPSSRGAPPQPRSRPEVREDAGITSQVAKLRQVRESLGRYQGLDRAVSVVPGEGLRRALYKRLTVEGARHLDPQAGLSTRDGTSAVAPVRPKARRRPSVLWAFVVLAAVGAALVLVHERTLPRELQAASLQLAVVPTAVKAPLAAEELPVLPKAVQPESVWLVEKGSGWEQYSNGLRIDTSFETAGDARRYRVFAMRTGKMGEAQTQPVGILFHTSESDIWPLDESNNEQLRVSSQRLLQYVRRIRAYHYMIDRFGRVFRVVAEDAKANHAGHSIWTRGEEVYLNLNHAFLGLCFETRWEDGQALPITQAQLLAGRNLTDFLRHRHKVAPEMCVTHGLTSVNPKKHLIGHHVDWARGFPFEAFGLPDQYEQPPPSMGLFGFGYDARDLKERLGEPWKGVFAAERALEDEARRSGRTLLEVRREKQALFDRWLADQAREDQRGSASAPAPPAPSGA